MNALISTYFTNIYLFFNQIINTMYRWIRENLFIVSSIEAYSEELSDTTKVSLYFRYQIIKLFNGLIKSIEYLRSIIDVKIKKIKLTYLDKVMEKKMILDSKNCNNLSLNTAYEKLNELLKQKKEIGKKKIVLQLEIINSENENAKICLKDILKEYDDHSDNTLENILYFEEIKVNPEDTIIIQTFTNRQRSKHTFKLKEIQYKNLHQLLELKS